MREVQALLEKIPWSDEHTGVWSKKKEKTITDEYDIPQKHVILDFAIPQ